MTEYLVTRIEPGSESAVKIHAEYGKQALVEFARTRLNFMPDPPAKFVVWMSGDAGKTWQEYKVVPIWTQEFRIVPVAAEDAHD